MYTYTDLLEIMDRLLGEGGCPWDQEQTHKSLRRHLIEEAYEVVEAIDGGKPLELQEELGDVLLQVVFHAKLAEKTGDFTMDDVVNSIAEKLVRRHPHVFSDTEVESAEEVIDNWEAIKKTEKPQKASGSILDKVPKNLPALHAAQKIQEKVVKVGFDWDTIDGVFEKVREEERELLEAMALKDQEKIEEEFGDLLFTLVCVSRFLNVDSEVALAAANSKFRRRFGYIEEQFQEKSLVLCEKNRKNMEKLWKESKNNV